MSSSFGMACVGISHPHVSVRLDVARRLEGVSVVGVSDPDPANEEALIALSNYLDVPVLSVEHVLDDPAIHAVIVEPWTYEMVDTSIRCAEAGKHVLVEKPGGSNPQDIERLVEAAKRTGRVIQVGYNFRFSPIVEWVAELLATGALGKIVQAQVHAAGPAGDSHYRWFNLPDDLGGCFWEDGCHIMDLIVHLFGPPKKVTAHISKFGSVSGVESQEDAVVAALEWDSMLMGFDFTSWEANDWLETWQFNLYGTEGTLRFQMLPERYELYLKEPKNGFQAGWTRWSETSFPTPWAGQPTPWEKWHIVANKSFFIRELTAFQRACESGLASPIPPSHARTIASVMQACYDSARLSGRTIEVAP